MQNLLDERKQQGRVSPHAKPCFKGNIKIQGRRF